MNVLKLISLSFVFWLTSIAYAVGQSDTLKVLFIGNSYTYSQNLPQVVSILSQSTPVYLSTRQSTAAGASLEQHWNGKKDLKSHDILGSHGFDVVIIQDHSRAGIERADSLYKYASLFIQKAKSMGVKPYLFQTWEREDEPDTFEKISINYQRIANDHKAVVIPVGTYWHLIKKINKDLPLYSADGSHPGRLGVFLTALVITKALTGTWPQLSQNELSTRDHQGEFIQLMYVESAEFETIMNSVSEIAIELK